MKKTLALLAAAMMISGPAFANHDMWKEKDTNGDGMITQAEFRAHADAKFAKMDTNSDGKITKAEADAHWKNKDHHGKTPNGTDDGDNGKSY